MSEHPNVLWICTDQQRFDTLGCYGNDQVKTPNLDRLASSGVLFENCFVQNPVCTPSRASFLTGRYPRTTRCRQNGQDIPSSEVLVTRLFADAGYNVGLAGKLHISACHPSVCKMTERRINDGYSVFHWSHDPGDKWPNNEYFCWLQDMGCEERPEPSPLSSYVKTGVSEPYHQTAWCADRAINFVRRNAGSDVPWMFSVNIFDPHHPFDPPAEYMNRYLDRLDDIPLPNYVRGETENKPRFQRIDCQGAYGHEGYLAFADMSDKDHRALRAAYWAMVDLIDAQVGRMLDALEETGQLENTIVVFASDHGEMLGDHGIYLKGPHMYDCAVHVPLIVSQPGTLCAGKRVGGLVEMVDLAPTLLDLAGLPEEIGMQGHSLTPVLLGQDAGNVLREDVYCEYYNANYPHTPRAYATMVRTTDHKLVAVHGEDAGELYDLESDPTETVNHWYDADYADIKTTMLKRLCDRMAFTIDPLPTRQSPW